jgi:hypothetical protein
MIVPSLLLARVVVTTVAITIITGLRITGLLIMVETRMVPQRVGRRKRREELGLEGGDVGEGTLELGLGVFFRW